MSVNNFQVKKKESKLMLILTYRVNHLPDLEKTEYHAKYGDDPAYRLLEMQRNFLYKLHTVANQYPLTYSLIYS